MFSIFVLINIIIPVKKLFVYKSSAKVKPLTLLDALTTLL